MRKRPSLILEKRRWFVYLPCLIINWENNEHGARYGEPAKVFTFSCRWFYFSFEYSLKFGRVNLN